MRPKVSSSSPLTTAIAGKKKWTNWAGNQSCRPRSEVRPVSRGELVDTVAGATAEGRRIRVPGSGHSFTGAALTDDLMVDISALSGVIDADLSSGLVKVGAGTVLADLNRDGWVDTADMALWMQGVRPERDAGDPDGGNAAE